MPEALEINEKILEIKRDKDIVDYFLSLKSRYEKQRKDAGYEDSWKEMRYAYQNSDKLKVTYKSPLQQVFVPIMDWKVNGLVARKMKVHFDRGKFARLEDKENTENEMPKIMDRYIFEHQLSNIQFKNYYRLFKRDEAILGTAVAKITQEYETREFSYFGEDQVEEQVVKDDTFFRPMVLEEFYSDINQDDIRKSQACIHATTITMQELLKNQKRTEIFTEPNFNDAGELVSESETEEEVGIYFNLGLFDPDDSITREQEEYRMTVDVMALEEEAIVKDRKNIKKTGTVQIDECWGLWDIDGDGVEEEVVATIAQGKFLIRFEETPFVHRRFTRPFLVGRHRKIPNHLYGESMVGKCLPMIYEINATRTQQLEDRAKSISPMWVMSSAYNHDWNGEWEPGKKITTEGDPNSFAVPLVSPYLGRIAIENASVIERDINQLTNLSPVQEGTSDSRLIPQTASGTAAVISQNDIQLNELIDDDIEEEIKPFIEILYERNLQFKTINDLLVVWNEEDLKEAGINLEELDMKKLVFDPKVKILGNFELNNEQAHQLGWERLLNLGKEDPNIARRLDKKKVAEKLLGSYGIKEELDDIWLDEDDVQATIQQEQQAQEQQIQEQLQMMERERQSQLSDFQARDTIETDNKIRLDDNEALNKMDIDTNKEIQEKKYDTGGPGR